MQTTDSKVDPPPASATTGAVVVQSSTLRPVCSSAICRLPTEILSEIFMHCLPQVEYLSPRTSVAPLLFTMICRRWRQVAIGFPRLWCRLRLEAWDTDWQKLAVCYDSWLERTGGCPLSLKLECNDWDKIQSILQPYARQISSLELHFCTKGLFMVEDFHALEELKITISPPLRYPSLSINRSLSKLPVNLRRLEARDLVFHSRQLDCFTDSSWARLTHLKVTIREISTFTGILRLCPNLTSMTTQAVFCPKDHAEALVTHVNLQSLFMIWHVILDPSESYWPFNYFTLPNLRVLEACYRRWQHEDFMEFLSRSKCSLERLVLDERVVLTAEQQEEYAALIPSFELSLEPDFLW